VSLWIIFAAINGANARRRTASFFAVERVPIRDFNDFFKPTVARAGGCLLLLTFGIASQKMSPSYQDNWEDQRHSVWFDLEPGSRDFHPFQAVADAVSSAHSLLKIVILSGDRSPRDHQD
jgi:hypothetical protein